MVRVPLPKPPPIEVDRAQRWSDSLLPPDPVNCEVKSESTSPAFAQHSRRYLGNKFKLVKHIRRVVAEKCPDCRSLADLFAGTGVVGAAFNAPNRRLVVNDLLRSNYVCLYSFLGVTSNCNERLKHLIERLNHVPSSKSNYFSQHFGGRYFSQDNARKIGAIRTQIDKINASADERHLLLCALIYATDKVANTVGHYDAFRKSLDMVQPIRLRLPTVDFAANHGNEIYCADANDLVRNIDCDVLYLDPPYNSRQYSDTYHVLENLVGWNKPVVNGVARKMDRSRIKSRYCTRSATDTLADLIDHASCRHVILSYNNTGDSMNGRSNARIADADIIEILSAKGDVEVFSMAHKAFTTGKNVAAGNAERLFYCHVRGVS